jgi:hypothetical protein
MIYGPKDDGAYIVDDETIASIIFCLNEAKGRALACRGEVRATRADMLPLGRAGQARNRVRCYLVKMARSSGLRRSPMATISMTREGRVAPGGFCGIMAASDLGRFGTESRPLVGRTALKLGSWGTASAEPAHFPERKAPLWAELSVE